MKRLLGTPIFLKYLDKEITIVISLFLIITFSFLTVFDFFLTKKVEAATSLSVTINLGGTGLTPEHTLFKASDGQLIQFYYTNPTGATQVFYYATSTDNGANWGTPVAIKTTSNPFSAALDAYMDSSNNIYLVYAQWHSTTGSLFSFRKLTYSSGSWTIGTEQSVDSSGTNILNPSVVKDSSGNVWVAYNYYNGTNYTIRVKESTDDGVTWSASTTLTATTTNSGGGVSLALYNSGQYPIAVYVAGCVTPSARAWNGSSWTTEVAVGSTNMCSTNYNVLSVGDSVYYVDAKASNATKYSIFNGTTWSALATVNSSTSDQYEPTLTTDGTSVWLVYGHNITTNSYDLYYKKYNGSSWDVSGTAITSDGVNNRNPKVPLLVSPNSTVPVVYVRGTSSPYTVLGTSFSIAAPTPVLSSISSGTPGESSVTITWTTDIASDSQVNYGLTSSYTASTTLDSTQTTSHSVAISGLSPSITYHYRVRSSNGNLSVSSDQTFTTPAPAPDNTPPTVGISVPTTGTYASSTAFTLTATSTDSVGVAGVRFKVDGVAIGTEGAGSPYSMSWDTTSVSDGSHSLVAVARDAAGNYATSTAVTVTVDNILPVISAVSSGTLSATGGTITWTTDVVADTQLEYGVSSSYGSVTTLNTTTSTSHSVVLSGLATSTTYHYRVRSRDVAGNLASSTDATFSTTNGAVSSFTISSNFGIGSANDYTLFKTTNNELVLIYWDVSGSAGNMYYRTSTDNGATWSVAVTIKSTLNSFGYRASAYMDSSNNVYLAYAQAHGAIGLGFYFKKLSYGSGSWTLGSEQTLEASAYYIGSPSIVKDSSGTLWLGYNYSDGANYSIKVITSTDDGVTWSASTALTTSTTGSGGGVSLALYNSGQYPIAVYMNGCATTNARAWNGTSWSTAVAMGSTNLCSTNFNVLSVGNSVYYVDAKASNVTYLNVFNGTSWSGLTSINLSSNDANDPVLTTDGTSLWLVYSHYNGSSNSYDLYYKRYNSGTWDPNGTAITSNALNNRNPKILQLVPTNSTTPIVYAVGTANPYTIQTTSFSTSISTPQISSVSATTTPTTATITWNTNLNTDSQIEYGLTSSYTASSTLSSTLTASHSVTLTNLTSNSTYHYRVLSSNGVLTVSSDQTFVTPVIPPDNTPPTVGISVPTTGTYASSTAFTLTATSTDSVGVAGVRFKVDGVAIGTEGAGSPYSMSWDTTSVSDGSHSLVAVARDAAGNYATSTAVTVTVDNILPVISAVSSGTSGVSTTTVAWLTDVSSDSQVEYGTSISYGSVTTLNITGVTSHSVALTGLSASTTYHYRVRSRDVAGNLASSTDATFETNIANVSISITQPTYGFNLIPNSVRRIYATVTNGVSNGVTWSVSGGGTLSSATGPYVDVTAPSSGSSCQFGGTGTNYTVTSGTTFTVTATSQDNVAKSSTITIKVCNPSTEVNIVPFYTTLYAGQKADLQSFIWGNVNNNVTWAITAEPSGGDGSLNDADNMDTIFSATVAGRYTITATSAGDNSKVGTATMYVTGNTLPYTVTPHKTMPVDCVADPAMNGTVYEVGPSQAYTTIQSVPWATLAAGSTVRIHNEDLTGSSPTTYHEYFQLKTQGTRTQPIRVCGVPDASGNLPILDGSNATGASSVSVFSAGYALVGMGLTGWAGLYTNSTYSGPQYLIVEGLKLQNAKPAYTYTIPGTSTTANWLRGAACIRIHRGIDYVIRGLDLNNCGNGIMAMFNGTNGYTITKNVLFEGNHMHNNGNSGSFLEHQLYIQGLNQVTQFNIIDGYTSGAAGSNLKSRGFPDIIRYNYFGDGPSRQLDLIDNEDAPQYTSFTGYLSGGAISFHATYPADVYPADLIAAVAEIHHTDYVYGNTFTSSKPAVPIHYTNDHGIQEGARQGTLWFYNNSFYEPACATVSCGNYRWYMFDTSSGGGNDSPLIEWPQIQAHNNAIWMDNPTQPYFFWDNRATQFTTFGKNVINSNWGTGNMSGGDGSGWVAYVSQYAYMDGANLAAHTNGVSNLVGVSSVPFDRTTFVANDNMAVGSALPTGAEKTPVRFQYGPTAIPVARSSSLVVGAMNIANPSSLDTTAPVISSISSGTPGQTSVTITWTTNESSDSQINYGLTSSYTTSTVLDSTLATSHSVTITGLTADTVYHYRVRSTDAFGNLALASDHTFTTGAIPDTAVPTVSLTAPTNGSTVLGNIVSLAATASDDVGVVGVQFKLDTNTLIRSEDTTYPYSLTWDSTGATDGTHTIIAVARDAAGNYATSSVITITADNTAPLRSGGSPSGTFAMGTTGATLSLTTNETATCHYSTSADTGYDSMTAFTTTNGVSHSTVVSGLSNGGSYVYYVKCADAQSTSNTTDYTISFTVAADATSPTTSITAPGNNSIVFGNAAMLSADATDDVSVTGVQFKLDTDTLINSEITSNPYNIIWDSMAVSDGVHTIIAVARDGSGNHATSSVVTITVDNTAPVRSSGSSAVTLASGTTGATLSLSTDEAATCKYSISSGTAYGLMTAFTTTGNTNHSTSIAGFSDGNSYIYYMKCSDSQGNTNATDYTVTFNVATETVPPAIYSVSSGTPTQSVATITWITDEASDSQIEYGTSSSYGSLTTLDTNLTTSHSITLSALSAGTTYHFRVLSKDALSNLAMSSEQTFNTVAIASNSGGSSSSGGGGGGGGIYPISTALIQATTTASGSSISLTSISTFQVKFTKDLQVGSIGADVLALQKYLNTSGFIISKNGAGAPGKETNIFGPATKLALMKFQKANSLPATGYFGPVTRALIDNSQNPSVATSQTTSLTKKKILTLPLQLGSQNDEVVILQQFLNENGFTVSASGIGSKGKETMYFGPATRVALIKFQKFNNITPAQGYLDSITRKAINDLLNK